MNCTVDQRFIPVREQWGGCAGRENALFWATFFFLSPSHKAINQDQEVSAPGEVLSSSVICKRRVPESRDYIRRQKGFFFSHLPPVYKVKILTQRPVIVTQHLAASFVSQSEKNLLPDGFAFAQPTMLFQDITANLGVIRRCPPPGKPTLGSLTPGIQTFGI
jgi:hypothetical protein